MTLTQTDNIDITFLSTRIRTICGGIRVVKYNMAHLTLYTERRQRFNCPQYISLHFASSARNLSPWPMAYGK